MNHKEESATQLLLNGEPVDPEAATDEPGRHSARSKVLLALGSIVLAACFTVAPAAHAIGLDIFNEIFGSIQNDMGKSLAAINQISQSVQKLYQTTMWPLAAINQARGFVSNSITSFRGQMAQMFNTPIASAVTPGPQQFESILHSRLSSQIPSLQASFTTNYGSIPPINIASPQDRVMMDIDDALGQENLKTTLIADQAGDVILDTANQMENQVALSTPGSNPYLTAQAPNFSHMSLAIPTIVGLRRPTNSNYSWDHHHCDRKRVMNSILLIDSETIAATALQAALSRFGFEVELADSGKAAHALLRREHFDLILVEFDLSPHPNGKAVIEPSKSATGCWSGTGLIRELRAARVTTPILVHTVLEGELYETASLDAGADDYIVKKAPVSMLLSRLHAHLRRSERDLGLAARTERRVAVGRFTLDRKARVLLADEKPKRAFCIDPSGTEPGI